MSYGNRIRRWSAWNILGFTALVGCAAPAGQRADADRAAYAIVEQKQQQALGRTEPFRVEPARETLRRRLLAAGVLPQTGPASLGAGDLPRPPGWPEGADVEGAGETPPADIPLDLELSLLDALQVAARNSREYQTQKETVFRSALALDLERDAFRTSFAGKLAGEAIHDGGTTGVETRGEASLSRTLRSGATFATRVGLDLAKLLSGDRDAALGLFADVSIAIPLLRGAGREVVMEPLTQAEQQVLYAIWEFERFKRIFAVRVTSEYLGVLRDLDQVANAEENYRGLIASTRRARRLADAGRLPAIQVGQVIQDELRARSRWIRALESYRSRLDRFKLTLGLPTDAEIRLDRAEFDALASSYQEFRADASDVGSSGGPSVSPPDAPIELPPTDTTRAGGLELEEVKALQLALEHRLDLRTALGRVADAQRQVVVAADALRAGLDLTVAARGGERRTLASADSGDASLRFDTGRYSALLNLDLPWERTAERNAFRETFLALEAAVRDLQQSEDQVKLEVRNELRQLAEARENIHIQDRALTLAKRRVRGTDLFLEAGRAEVRDLLEAREALLSAQNAVTEATIAYRTAELSLQRDLGLLQVDERGLWQEYDPSGKSGAD
jgi:outer membrane protein TolC